jgi:pyruvate,water dikinase
VVGEDSAGASFAGMFDSHVFLRDLDAVLAAIPRCWASAFTERALAYQLERGGSVQPPAMALVIQRAVAGRSSGVLFTANPVSGRDDEALLSATWGLAEGVVSGRCDTDEIVAAHDGTERSITVARKEILLAPGPDGVIEQPVKEGLRDARALDPDEVGDLVKRSVQLAQAFAAPLDIEWTITGAGELYFLQARPITARAAAAPLGVRRTIWDNSNIQESFNGITTPLTFSVAVRAYASVYEQSLRLVGVPDATIERHRPVLRNMIGLVDGRVYYNIESWYRCLLLLPFFDRSKDDMERMMGLEHPVDVVQGVSLTRAERLARMRALIPVGVRLWREFRRLERTVDAFLSTFERRIAAFDRDRIARAGLDELLAMAERIDREIVGDWTAPIVNDVYVMTTTGRVRKRLLAAGRRDADELIAALLSGEDGIESMEPTRRLLQMAALIRGDAALRELLSASEDPHAVLAALRARSPELDRALDGFLERYGDRCMGEMKLETLSLRQDPGFIVQVLRNYVAAEQPLDSAALDAREHARRAAAEQDALRGMGARRARALRRALADARRAVKWRENMRLSRTRFVGLYRDIYLAAGERLHEAGLLDEPRDVLYLTRDELLAYEEGTAVSADLAALARLRKHEYEGYDGRPGALPNHFETIGGVYAGRRASPDGVTAAGRVLQGIGCSAGVVEARVRVIESPRDDLDVGGRILTAMRTDPGWTPLFPSAAGILVERGSTLSHSAVLAREFGIPAVVGVPGLLEALRDGELVRLDGGAGTIERLEVEQ